MNIVTYRGTDNNIYQIYSTNNGATWSFQHPTPVGLAAGDPSSTYNTSVPMSVFSWQDLASPAGQISWADGLGTPPVWGGIDFYGEVPSAPLANSTAIPALYTAGTPASDFAAYVGNDFHLWQMNGTNQPNGQWVAVDVTTNAGGAQHRLAILRSQWWVIPKHWTTSATSTT
jgi:hypothetical protein